MSTGDLGHYVRVTPRKKGPPVVTFEMPARLRPQGFPYSHHLPLGGEPARLDTLEGRSAIRRDADALLVRAKAMKAAATPCPAMGPAGPAADQIRPSGRQPTGLLSVPSRRTVDPWLVAADIYFDSEEYKGHKPATQISNGQKVRVIVQALMGLEGYDPVTLTQSKAERVLQLFEHSLDAKRRALSMLNKLLAIAVRELGRPPHLNLTTKLKAPKRQIGSLWCQSDVDVLAEAFDARDLGAISGIILTGWEIGQRITDIAAFRYGEEWAGEEFSFSQSKTNAPVVIPSPRLASLLTGRVGPGEALFQNPYTGRPYAGNVLSAAFKRVTDSLPEYRDRGLTLRHLRHSCILEFARAGCSVPEIASITGHSLPSVYTTLMHYLGRDSVLAWNAVAKREQMRAGIICGHAWQASPPVLLALPGLGSFQSL